MHNINTQFEIFLYVYEFSRKFKQKIGFEPNFYYSALYVYLCTLVSFAVLSTYLQSPFYILTSK